MSNAIKECIVSDMTPEEYMAWKLVEINSTGERLFAVDYVQKYGKPSEEIITKLVSRELIYSPLKKEPPYTYNDVLVKRMNKDLLLELAEELWDNYPATFPLSTGGLFVARTGGKEISLLTYMNMIKWSEEKHHEVMLQLKRYIKAVESGKINGCKFSDWINNEMWKTMKDIPDQEIGYSEFKIDI